MISSEARGAWVEIEARLRPWLARRVASASDVDDLLQEIFVRVHRRADDLRDQERFGAWIYRVAQNVVSDFGRTRTRDARVKTSPALEPADSDPDGESASRLQNDLAGCVALFVARLPSPYREAVTLTELEGLTQKDAAEVLGVSLPAVKSRVQRGREKIRTMFDECCSITVDGRGRVIECEPRALDEIPEQSRDAAREWSTRRC